MGTDITIRLRVDAKQGSVAVKGLGKDFKGLAKDANQVNIAINVIAKSGRKLRGVKKDADGMAKAFKNLRRITQTVRAAVIAFGARLVVAHMRDFTKSVVAAQAAMESMFLTLKAAGGGSANFAASSIAFITEESRRLGISMENTGRQFAKFQAATKQAGITVMETRNVFKSFAEAGVVVGLTGSDMNLVFLALEQIASKGRVASEELRRQLGERLPGAMSLAAKSMGVTTAELNRMLKAGEVGSKEFLPKFAQAVETAYGIALPDAMKSTRRAIGAAQQAFFELRVAIGKAFAPAVKQLLDKFTEAVADLQKSSEAQDFIDSLATGFESLMGIITNPSFVSGFKAIGFGAQTAMDGLEGFNKVLAIFNRMAPNATKATIFLGEGAFAIMALRMVGAIPPMKRVQAHLILIRRQLKKGIISANLWAAAIAAAVAAYLLANEALARYRRRTAAATEAIVTQNAVLRDHGTVVGEVDSAIQELNKALTAENLARLDIARTNATDQLVAEEAGLKKITEELKKLERQRKAMPEETVVMTTKGLKEGITQTNPLLDDMNFKVAQQVALQKRWQSSVDETKEKLKEAEDRFKKGTETLDQRNKSVEEAAEVDKKYGGKIRELVRDINDQINAQEKVNESLHSGIEVGEKEKIKQRLLAKLYDATDGQLEELRETYDESISTYEDAAEVLSELVQRNKELKQSQEALAEASNLENQILDEIDALQRFIDASKKGTQALEELAIDNILLSDSFKNLYQSMIEGGVAEEEAFRRALELATALNDVENAASEAARGIKSLREQNNARAEIDLQISNLKSMRDALLEGSEAAREMAFRLEAISALGVNAGEGEISAFADKLREAFNLREEIDYLQTRADIVRNAWENAASSIGNAFGDFFAEIVETGKFNFESLAKAIWKIFVNMLAEMLSAWIANELSKTKATAAGASQRAAIDGAGGAAGGSAGSLAGAGGGAAAGAGGLSSAAIGMGVFLVAAIAIVALAKRANAKIQRSALEFEQSGETMSFTVVAFSERLKEVSSSMATAMTDAFNTFEDVTGTILTGLPDLFVTMRKNGKNIELIIDGMLRGTFDSIEEATSAAVRKMIAMSDRSELGPAVRAVLVKASYEWGLGLEEFQRRIKIASDIDNLGISETEAAFKALKIEMSRLTEEALAAGIAVEDIARYTGEQFLSLKQQIEKDLGILSELDPFEKALQSAEEYNRLLDEERRLKEQELAGLQQQLIDLLGSDDIATVMGEVRAGMQDELQKIRDSFAITDVFGSDIFEATNVRLADLGTNLQIALDELANSGDGTASAIAQAVRSIMESISLVEGELASLPTPIDRSKARRPSSRSSRPSGPSAKDVLEDLMDKITKWAGVAENTFQKIADDFIAAQKHVEKMKLSEEERAAILEEIAYKTRQAAQQYGLTLLEKMYQATSNERGLADLQRIRFEADRIHTLAQVDMLLATSLLSDTLRAKLEQARDDLANFQFPNFEMDGFKGVMDGLRNWVTRGGNTFQQMTRDFEAAREHVAQMEISEAKRARLMEQILALQQEAAGEYALTLLERVYEATGQEEKLKELERIKFEVQRAQTIQQISLLINSGLLGDEMIERLKEARKDMRLWEWPDPPSSIDEAIAGLDEFFSQFETDGERALQQMLTLVGLAQDTGMSMEALLAEWGEGFRRFQNEVSLSALSLIDAAYQFAGVVDGSETAARLRWRVERTMLLAQLTTMKAALAAIGGLEELIGEIDVVMELVRDAAFVWNPPSSGQNPVVDAIDNQTDDLENALDGLRDLMKDLLLGDLSTLNPEQKMAAARDRYQDLIRRAGNNDIDAINELQQFVPEFLRLAEAFYGGTATTGYGEIFSRIFADLSRITGDPNPLLNYGASSSSSGSESLVASFESYKSASIAQRDSIAAGAAQQRQQQKEEISKLGEIMTEVRDEIVDLKTGTYDS